MVLMPPMMFFILLVNLTNIIGGIKTIVQAGLLPYYDEEPDESDSNGAIGPFLDLDVKIRNSPLSPHGWQHGHHQVIQFARPCWALTNHVRSPCRTPRRPCQSVNLVGFASF